jgi:hypothetical protein
MQSQYSTPKPVSYTLRYLSDVTLDGEWFRVPEPGSPRLPQVYQTSDGHIHIVPPATAWRYQDPSNPSSGAWFHIKDIKSTQPQDELDQINTPVAPRDEEEDEQDSWSRWDRDEEEDEEEDL